MLIFNHGSVGVPSLYTALMEELASYGYIIFSIGHADYTPFFDKYLKGEDSGLLNEPSSLYPEVEIKVKNIR
ncbi:hypothetical protein ES705_35325 [subsurface metagenome]